MYYYVYQITDLQKQKFYIGSRKSELHPDLDLGEEYFSSSTNKKFIEEQKRFPENFEYDVLQTFPNYEEALSYENELLRAYNAKSNGFFINGRTRKDFEIPNSRPAKSLLLYLGQLIRIARKEKGISQQELCERLSVSRGRIKRIEQGNPEVAIGVVIEACFILGIPLLGCEAKDVDNLAKMLSYMNKLIPLNIPAKNIDFDDNF